VTASGFRRPLYAVLEATVESRHLGCVPERVAMQMTGHKARSVFERYNIVSAGDLREAAKRLDAATGTISGTISQIGDQGRKSEIRKSLCDNS
jgi:hypothetical protein